MTNKKAKILVVGSGGQLGYDCIRKLGAMGDVQGLDLPDLDITDGPRTQGILDDIRPDVIVNCAAYTAVDDCESDAFCWKVNAEGPAVLADWTAAQGAYMVHISTDYVFAGAKPLYEPCLETDHPDPISEYGLSKRAGEQAVLESGAKAAILRTGWLYGEKGRNFLKTMLRLAVQQPEREIKVVNDQFGSPTSSYTLARQIAVVIQAEAAGLFHATSEGHCCWYELADRFLRLMEIPHILTPCSSAEHPTAAPRPKNSILENARLKEAGLNLFDDWRNELTRFVDRCGISVLKEVGG